MSILPKSWQGFGAAMGEVSPMLLSMGAAMQNGKSPFVGAQAGLAQMMQQDASEEDKRRWEAEMELRRQAFELQKQAAARAAANAGRSAGAGDLRQAADLAALGALFGDSGPASPLASSMDTGAPMGLDMGTSGPAAAPMGLDMGASLDLPQQTPLASVLSDTMVGGQGQDTLLGGDGADMLAAPAGSASLFGNFQPTGGFDLSPMGQKLQGVYGKQMYAPRQQPTQQPQAQPGGLTPERRQQLMQIVANPRVSEPLRNRAMQILMPQPKEPDWQRSPAADGSVWLYDANNPQNMVQLSGPAAPERKIVTGADGYQYYTDGSRVLPGVNKPPERTSYDFRETKDGSVLALNPNDPNDVRTAYQGAPEPPKLSAAEEKIARLEEFYPRQIAVAIADGVLAEVSNPVTGDTEIVNKATGETVFSTRKPPETAPDVPAGPRQENPADPLAPPTYSGATDSFGPPGFVKGVINRIGDITGMGTAFPDVQKTQSALNVFGETLLNDISSAYDRQPPSWLLKNIEALIPTPGNPLSGAEDAKSRFMAIGSSLGSELEGTRRALSTRDLSPKVRQDLESRAATLEKSVNEIRQVLRGFGVGDQSQQNGGVTSSGFKWRVVE